MVIASARGAIPRAQALLEDNEQMLASEKKMEELETSRNKVQ